MGAGNAGKSRLLNALSEKRKLQLSGKRVGITHSIYFFALGKKEEKPKGFLLDSPGYGKLFLKLGPSYCPKRVRKRREWMMWRFLSHAVRLRMILLCVNAKIGLRPLDI